jgi:hypothetical protein
MDLQIFVAAMHDENADAGFYINTGIFARTAREYAEKNRVFLYDRLTLPLLVNEAHPLQINVSQTSVICPECGALTSMKILDEPTTGACINGHPMINKTVRSDLRIFSTNGTPYCERCGSPMKII